MDYHLLGACCSAECHAELHKCVHEFTARIMQHQVSPQFKLRIQIRKLPQNEPEMLPNSDRLFCTMEDR